MNTSQNLVTWQNNSAVSIDCIGRSGQQRTFRIKISGQNDDDRRATTLIVLLPINSHVYSSGKSNGIVFKDCFEKTYYQIQGASSQELPDNSISNEIDSYIEFKIQQLSSKEEFYVDITIKPLENDFKTNDSIAAFSYSLIPELDKKNNYAIEQL